MASRPERLSAYADASVISAHLEGDGLVVFEGVQGRAGVVDLAHRLMRPWQHRDADADGVTVLRDRGALADKPGFAGFGAGELRPHTESSALAVPPRLLMLICGSTADHGGESLIVDGAAVYADLAADPEVVARLCEPRSVRFATGRWGSVFTPTADGRWALRLRLDDLAFFTPPVRDVLPALVEAIHRHQRILPLQRSEGYLLDNRRMLHGRRAFTGHRVMYRVLGDLADAVRLPIGFSSSAAVHLAQKAL
jgi:alpha-ketoglutarate-dependent taurine dioxygenase